MNKKRIGIIFGGNSPEHDVSLESAYSVITNMNEEKYDKVLIGITKEGNWYKYEGEVENIKNNTWKQKGKCTKIVLSTNTSDKGIIELENNNQLTKLDAIFPVLHGSNGEDGTIQGLIKLSGIPLVGCDTLSSSLCMDKHLSHKIVESYGIKVAKGIVINNNTSITEVNEKLKQLKYPVFVKPIRAGSSFGITKVKNESEIEGAIKEALKYDTEIIIEENIDGIELGCAVLGNEELIVGEIDEIELSTEFFSYPEKYTLETSKIHVPARIDKKISDEAKETAKKIYKILKCRNLARVDMFLTPKGEIYFNEINTIPGFTSHSRYPSMMKQVGINFEQLIDKLIELGIEETEMYIESPLREKNSIKSLGLHCISPLKKLLNSNEVCNIPIQ
ncbi:MAG: D-alanine--D-serine ligase VanG [Clostridia bacterium]|nr:D-alanine--D-serine ligase VanG [Clostridia bacterium]